MNDTDRNTSELLWNFSSHSEERTHFSSILVFVFLIIRWMQLEGKELME